MRFYTGPLKIEGEKNSNLISFLSGNGLFADLSSRVDGVQSSEEGGSRRSADTGNNVNIF